jgi:hypothetical protein
VRKLGKRSYLTMRLESDRLAMYRNLILFLAVSLTLFLACASEPVPVYAPAPSSFDLAWSAALGAARDEGVQVLSEDRASGNIKGIRGDQEVTINMRGQADGSVRVEISQRGPKGADPGLANRVSRAYDRRMGR